MFPLTRSSQGKIEIESLVQTQEKNALSEKDGKKLTIKSKQLIESGAKVLGLILW